MSKNFGEKEKSYQYHGMTQDDMAKKRAEKIKYFNNVDKQVRKITDKQSLKVNINGVEYSSVSKASLFTGISKNLIFKHLRELENSSFSELEKNIKIVKTFTFKKVK